MEVIEYWPSLIVTKLSLLSRVFFMMYALSNTHVISPQGKQKLLCGVMSDTKLNVSWTFNLQLFWLSHDWEFCHLVSKIQYKANRFLPLLQTALIQNSHLASSYVFWLTWETERMHYTSCKLVFAVSYFLACLMFCFCCFLFK